MHHAAQTEAKNTLDLDVGLRRFSKELLPKLRDCFLPFIPRAIRGWSCVLENAIVAHQLHHPCDIMTVEGFIERQDNTGRSLYFGHTGWAHTDYGSFGRELNTLYKERCQNSVYHLMVSAHCSHCFLAEFNQAIHAVPFSSNEMIFIVTFQAIFLGE